MPTKRHNATGLLDAARKRGMIRLRDARDLGFHPELLRRLVEAGSLVRVSRGVYGPADAEPSEHHSLAVVAARVLRGVVCLLSALRFHGLGTQDPAEVWLAVGSDDRLPRIRQPRVRAVRFAAAVFSRGVDRHQIEGVTVRIYSPAKTVVDCRRLREEVGVDVTLEALRDALRTHVHARRRLAGGKGAARRDGRPPLPGGDDVDFGDVITPPARPPTYPTPLLNLPPPVLAAYPAETVVAEKVQAMVDLEMANTWLKDFCDVWLLLRDFDLDDGSIAAASRATFARRHTPLPATLPTARSEAFADDAAKRQQWAVFVDRSGVGGVAPPFGEVIDALCGQLPPLLNAM